MKQRLLSVSPLAAVSALAALLALAALSCGGAGNRKPAIVESEPLMNRVEAPLPTDKPELCIALREPLEVVEIAWGDGSDRLPPDVDEYALVELIDPQNPPEPLLVERSANDGIVIVYEDCRQACTIGVASATGDGRQLKNRADATQLGLPFGAYVDGIMLRDWNRDGIDELWMYLMTSGEYNERGHLVIITADDSLAPLWTGELPLEGSDPCSGELSITDVDCDGHPDMVIGSRCCARRSEGYCDGPQQDMTRTAYWWNPGTSTYELLATDTYHVPDPNAY